MSPRAVVAAAVIAVAWLRLESPADSRAFWAVALFVQFLLGNGAFALTGLRAAA